MELKDVLAWCIEATSFDSKHPFTLFTYVLKIFKCPAGIAVYCTYISDAMADLCCLLGSPSTHKEIQGKKRMEQICPKSHFVSSDCVFWIWFNFFAFSPRSSQIPSHW